MSRWRIKRTRRAENDLIDIWSYVAQDSVAAADRLLDRIEARCRQLSEQPRSGPARADISAEARHLVIGNILVFYRIENDEVVLLRVLDGRRNITARDLDP